MEKLLARENQVNSEINAIKAQIKVLKLKQTSKEDTLASIRDEIALAQIEKSYKKKHSRLDGQDAKKQKHEYCKQKFANRVNVHDPTKCDQILKTTGLKCQKSVGREGQIIDGVNWCKSCLQNHLLAEFTSKQRFGL